MMVIPFRKKQFVFCYPLPTQLTSRTEVKKYANSVLISSSRRESCYRSFSLVDAEWSCNSIQIKSLNYERPNSCQLLNALCFSLSSLRPFDLTVCLLFLLSTYRFFCIFLINFSFVRFFFKLHDIFLNGLLIEICLHYLSTFVQQRCGWIWIQAWLSLWLCSLRQYYDELLQSADKTSHEMAIFNEKPAKFSQSQIGQAETLCAQRNPR